VKTRSDDGLHTSNANLTKYDCKSEPTGPEFDEFRQFDEPNDLLLL
jgi:hypothetical protein